MNAELLTEIIAILKEEHIAAVYRLVGSRPVYFSALHRSIIHKRILADLQAKMSLKAVADKYEVSEKTVRRLRDKK